MQLKTIENKVRNLKLTKKQREYLENCYCFYDIEFQSLNDLLIKKHITITEYNKSILYNNRMLKKDLLKLTK
tara:strand:- start:676 stop:891 length:216 start_codon:yes stop_codon:yes gene_type:complete